MRLPKIFAMLRKSILKRCQFLTVKNRPKISRFYSAFDFRKSLFETTKSFKNFDIFWKFQYIFDIFNIQQYIFKIFNILFWYIPV